MSAGINVFFLPVRLILLICSLSFLCAVLLRFLLKDLLHDAAGGLPFLCVLAKLAVPGVILYLALQDFGVFSTTRFLRRLVIFGISIACLYYVQVISMELSNLGTEVIGSIGSEISEVSFENTLRDTIYEETTYEPGDRTWSVESIGKYLNAFIASLKYIAVFSLPWLMTWIATIMIRAACISRSLELTLGQPCPAF